MPKSKGELFFLLFILLGSLYLFRETFNFGGTAIGGHLGPSFWPQMIIIGIVITCVILLVRLFLAFRRHKGAAEASSPEKRVNFFIALTLIVAYLYLLPKAGFIALTPLFLVAFRFLLGQRSLAWMAGVSLSLTAIIIVLFTRVMYVPIPRGEGFFRQFSLWFY
jgi:hypothetical protein